MTPLSPTAQQPVFVVPQPPVQPHHQRTNAISSHDGSNAANEFKAAPDDRPMRNRELCANERKRSLHISSPQRAYLPLPSSTISTLHIRTRVLLAARALPAPQPRSRHLLVLPALASGLYVPTSGEGQTFRVYARPSTVPISWASLSSLTRCASMRPCFPTRMRSASLWGVVY